MKKLSASFKKLEDWLYNNGFEQGLKDRSLAIPLAVCTVVFLAAFLWWRINSAKQAGVRSQIAAFEAKSQAADEYNNAMVLWAEFAKGGPFVSHGTDSKEWLSMRVYSYAREANMEIMASNPADETALGDLKSQSEVFTLEGSYYDLGRFIAKLESSRPFIGISRLAFTRSSPEDLSKRKSLSVELQAFVLKESAGEAKPLSPGPPVE